MLAVVATAVLHQVVSNVLGLHAVFVAVAVLCWTGYLVWRLRKEPGLLATWGFGRANARRAWWAATAVGLAGVAAMAAVGAARGHLEIRAALWATLLLYPIWGLVQQTLVQVFVARNLRRAPAPLGAMGVVIMVCAVLFALVHAPDVALMAATGVLGAAFTAIYLRWPNLWPLGFWHGWLGAFFYAWVLGRYPLVEMLSS